MVGTDAAPAAWSLVRRGLSAVLVHRRSGVQPPRLARLAADYASARIQC